MIVAIPRIRKERKRIKIAVPLIAAFYVGIGGMNASAIHLKGVVPYNAVGQVDHRFGPSPYGVASVTGDGAVDKVHGSPEHFHAASGVRHIVHKEAVDDGDLARVIHVQPRRGVV